MKTIWMAFSLSMILSASAFSLGATNCSNADGSLKRVEKQRWGMNSVTWTYQGKEVESSSSFQIRFNQDSKQVLSGIDGNGTFLVQVSVLDQRGNVKEEQFVICKEWHNLAVN